MDKILTFQNDYDYSFSNFVYRGEGNANLVIAHLKDEVVIRFRKQKTKNDLPTDDGYSRIIREVHFANKVLLHLLGCYVNVPEIVYYNYKNIDDLISSIRDFRPAIRISKSVIEPFATKMPDYTLLPTKLYRNSLPKIKQSNPTFCVEIKPKQGYICEPDRIIPKCPFCLKQFQKVKTSKGKMSDYCPFDLFSGDQTRMKKAILNLMKCPQNNFKIFKNGLCRYDENSSQPNLFECVNEIFDCDNTDLLSALLIKILLHPFCKEEFLTPKHTLRSDIKISENLEIDSRIEASLINEVKRLLNEFYQKCDFRGNTLPEGCVLERILQMQKLHQHGDDVVYAIYEKYYDVLCDNLLHTNVINTFENAKMNNNKSMKDIPKEVYNSYYTELTPSKNELNILQNYLLFSTAKDCSIMICFQKLDEFDDTLLDSANVIELAKDYKFMVNVNISDVDLKSVHCIERHCKRDSDIVRTVISTLSSRSNYD